MYLCIYSAISNQKSGIEIQQIFCRYSDFQGQISQYLNIYARRKSARYRPRFQQNSKKTGLEFWTFGLFSPKPHFRFSPKSINNDNFKLSKIFLYLLLKKSRILHVFSAFFEAISLNFAVSGEVRQSVGQVVGEVITYQK